MHLQSVGSGGKNVFDTAPNYFDYSEYQKDLNNLFGFVIPASDLNAAQLTGKTETYSKVENTVNTVKNAVSSVAETVSSSHEILTAIPVMILIVAVGVVVSIIKK